MDFHILGPLEVVDRERSVSIGGAKQRALLAVLLLRANQPVSIDRIVEDLWAGSPPKTASHVVQVYVSELRKALGDGIIATQRPGYMATLGPQQLDLSRFERLTAEGREALDRGDSDDAARLLGDALRLWRGAPLADFTYEAFAQGAIARLEEMRLAALEERIEADLRLGRHAQLVAELEPLVEEHPLRERPRGQLMLALYRSGRQAEALEAYQKTRQALVDELGIDPSPALQDLERAILRQDGSLDWADTRQARVAPPSLPAARAILLAGDGVDEIDALLPLGVLLAGARTPHELILLALLGPGGDPFDVSGALQGRRSDLAERGVQARVAAFGSDAPASDILRMAGQQDVDLLLAGHPDVEKGLDEGLRRVLDEAPCDVAFRIGGREHVGTAEGEYVLVPFGGGEHDWAALELGAWAASSLDVPLQLVGVDAEPESNRRDAGRLLATASLAVQQLAGITTRPALGERGAEAVVTAAEGARLVVVGLPAQWRSESIGDTRREVAEAARPPVLAARRGTRPGGLSPPEGLTRFTWSVSATR